MNNISNLSTKVQQYVQEAILEAKNNQNPLVTLVHLLKVIIIAKDDVLINAVKETGNKLNSVLEKLNYIISNYGKEGYYSTDNLATSKLDSNFSTIFNLMQKQSKDLKLKTLTVDLLLQAIFSYQNEASNLFLNKETIINNINKLRGKFMQNGEVKEENLHALEKYAVDLTEKAKQGKIDPIIGREEEIRRAMQVLSRRSKNNPILIGEPGVGKTSIVEGLAQRIVNKDVPDSLQNKKILSLDMGLVMAGAKYRGELEDRLKTIIKEVTDSNGEVILFIDEIHVLMGVGGDQGSISAANLLKPALARGELRCVGATTLKEYRENIEKDAALTRRFQYILVEEPSKEDAIAMLRGVKEKLEIHHGVKIQDSAIILAVKLAVRYIHDRFLPDKALDLLEEAASRLKLELTSRPESVDSLERQLIILKMEKEALSKEDIKNQSSKKRLEEVSNKIEITNKELKKLTEKWQKEKNTISNINNLKEELDKLKYKLSSALKDGKYEEAGKYQYELIPELEKQVLTLEENNKTKDGNLLHNVVSEELITSAVAKITGIPLEKLNQIEKDKLLNLENYLGERIIGQEKAIRAVSTAIRRSKAGISPENKPVGVFLFLGPTGVGKTELSKALADVMFGSTSSIMRIDMSEYMEKHSISKLIGSPPGYVGYEEGGVLTESVRRNPWQIILFDEVEKAHPEVFNLMLQIFDAGRLSDRSGRIIDFSNTIIILTSNLGAEYLENIEKEVTEDVENKILQNLSTFFRPEFINRIDDIIVFNRLDKVAMNQIVKIQLQELNLRMQERYMQVSFKSPEIEDYLINKGFDKFFGARPLKRLIQKELYDLLAIKIIEGSIKEEDSITFSVKDNKILGNIDKAKKKNF